VPANVAAGAPLATAAVALADQRDRIRWGPIWAGTVATFVVFLLLEVLLVGLGLLTPITTATSGNPGLTSAIVTAIVGLIAFFVGGWLAGATSSVRGTDAGVLDGLMVWGLAVTLLVGLSFLGLSSIFGVLGNIIAQFLGSGRVITNPGVPVNPGAVASTAQGAALGVFLGLVLSGVAAALGGWVASLYDPIGHLFHVREMPVRRAAPRAGTRLPA
jgi:hypothetical protein